jgi:CRP/FNR family transcriptional regulator
VRKLAVCTALNDREIAAVAAIQSHHDLAAGQAVFYEGDAAEHIYNVVDGIIRLSKLLSDGRRLVSGFLVPGDFLGFARDDVYTYTAEAVHAAALCRMPRLKFRLVAERYPHLERHVLSRASSEIVEAQEQMLLLGRRSPLEKLATFLLRFRARAERQGAAHAALKLDMPRADIADYLGVTTETVSRAFTRLRSEGCIALPDPYTVVFTDLDRLRQMTW